MRRPPLTTWIVIPAVFPPFVAGSPSNKEILFDKALQAV
jgi:hypothetical protein